MIFTFKKDGKTDQTAFNLSRLKSHKQTSEKRVTNHRGKWRMAGDAV